MKLLKLFVIVTLSVALIWGLALPALASSFAENSGPGVFSQAPGENQGKGPVQTIRGVVKSKDGDVINLDSLQVTVNDKTKYKVPGVKDASLADIKAGMFIVAQTVEENQKYIAKRVSAVPGQSAVERYSGKILSYSYNPPNGGSITIVDKSGKELTFQIVGSKFNIRPAGAMPKVGDSVTLVVTNEPPRNEKEAVGIVIHYPILQVTGLINSIDETAKTITVGTTVVKYNDKTVFTLRGILAVKVGQTATVFYQQQPDGSLLAKRVRIN